ncbi:MAG TPA: hypothetical protein VN946_10745 [Terriglobales bacterium]|jgi:hypothetical protein|nr:hypothetical protein [Terriglobales bacterium]
MSREMPLPELLEMAIDSLNGEAAYLRVMSLGRPEPELIALNRAAEKISKLGSSLQKLVVSSNVTPKI